ncbi:hypothetical protein OROMI_024989 [Orobanche minor]
MSASPSSSSSAEDGGGGAGGGGGGEVEGPSSSRIRMRPNFNDVWPEPFVEALALQVAIDASRTLSRLSAAQAIFNVFQILCGAQHDAIHWCALDRLCTHTPVQKWKPGPSLACLRQLLFQVCSTWHAVSRSDLLWRNLARRVWNVGNLARDTWRDEYIYRHRTARNFRLSRSAYTTIHVVPTDISNNDSVSCCRLALSNHLLAAGFADGAVHLYRLSTGDHVFTFYPDQHRNRLGRFSSAVSGIILTDTRLVFASLDGDVHVAVVSGGMAMRRAHLGDVMNDGALIDFSGGDDRWWVGLYAGVPGHSFHIWNGVTEELVFVGGTLTDSEAVTGWHTLTETTDLIGRIRVTCHNTAVACTSLKVVVFDLQNQGVVLGEEEFRRGIIVGSFDSSNELALITDVRGSSSVRRVANLEETSRFVVRGGRLGLGEVLGCVNGGCGLVLVGGVIRVWEIENGGEYLYRFRETIGVCSALIADERYVVAYSTDGTIHIWDYGA